MTRQLYLSLKPKESEFSVKFFESCARASHDLISEMTKNPVPSITESLSAMDRKKIHDSSTHVFPVKSKGVNNAVCAKKPRQNNVGAFGTTSYSIDFAKKEGKPAVPRPCSVTRRNRPHPSQNFLNWRIPSSKMFFPGQIDVSSEAFLLLSAAQTQQRFYDDYVGTFKKRSQRLLNREEMDKNTVPAFLLETDGRNGHICLSESHLPLCIKKSALPKFNEWIIKLSSEDKTIVDDCLNAADRGYLEQVLDDIIQPEAIPQIQKWLRGHQEQEREVAISFLKGMRSAEQSDRNGKNPRQSNRQKKCQSLLCAPRRTADDLMKAGRNAILFEVQGTLLPKRNSRKTTGSGFPRRRPLKCAHPSDTNDWHKLPKMAALRNLPNKRAVFMQPHREMPRHFEIHPEL